MQDFSSEYITHRKQESWEAYEEIASDTHLMMIEGDLSNYHHHTETETEDDREVANLSSSHTLVVRVPKKIHQIVDQESVCCYLP